MNIRVPLTLLHHFHLTTITIFTLCVQCTQYTIKLYIYREINVELVLRWGDARNNKKWVPSQGENLIQNIPGKS